MANVNGLDLILFSLTLRNANYIDGNLANTITDEIAHFALNTIVLFLESAKLSNGEDSFHLKYNLMHLKVKPYDILVYAQDCDSSADLSNSELF